jgi:hypothetical protein
MGHPAVFGLLAEPAEGLALEEEVSTGFRAVSEDELYNINETGQFGPSLTGGEGKYFFDSEQQAWDFGNRTYGPGNFGVVQGQFPSTVPVEPINPATEGPGFWVPNQYLPNGTPTILWPN